MYLMASVAHIHTGPPLRPSGVNVETRDFKTDNYSVFVSWEEVQRADYYIIYTITVNINSVNITMNSSATTTIPAISFEAMYNNFIEVSIEASNCAGSSETVTTDVYEGMYYCTLAPAAYLKPSFILSLSWLFSSQSPCQWQCQ